MKSIHFANLIFHKAKKNPNKEILFYKDNYLSKWIGITWKQLSLDIMSIAKALQSLDAKYQNNIGICSQNNIDSIIVEFANFANRCVSVPLYATSSVEQIEYIINDANLSIIFVGEQLQYDNAIKAAENCPTLKHIIAFDESVDLKKHTCGKRFSELLNTGRSLNTDQEVKNSIESAKMTDLAVIMYTSGTTGEPKGVMLPHSVIEEGIRIHHIRMDRINKNDSSVAFLPLSHIFERAWTYVCLEREAQVYICNNPQNIQSVIKEIRPSLMCSVPRFWEKVAAGVQDKIESFSPAKKGMVMWALSVGKEFNLDYRRLGKHAPFNLWLRYKIADKLIFSKLKKTIGIENGKVFPVGGAALDSKLATFFHSMGIPLVHGYGLTETAATVTCYEHRGYDLATAGTIMPGVQVKLSEDNEIMVKGKTVFAGYFNKPEATAAAFQDGWFKTGDAGKFVNGQLVILERIKDLFKTSNGKYIAPQQIETKLGADRYIEQIAVIGDKRNYVTAIIAPNIPAVKAYAEEIGLQYTDLNTLFNSTEIIKLFEDRIQIGQADMAPFETIKKFRFIRQGFSMEAGELTSTLKLRRAVIQQNYKSLIDEMYDEKVNIFL